MGANEAQAAFHQLPVAFFTGAQSGFGFPLLGHVRTGHDHKAHFVLGIGQRCGGPGNAPHTSCLGAPVNFKGLGGVARAHLLEDADGGLAFSGREELFRKGAAGEVGKTVAGNGFAGAIEAHDAARDIEYQHQRTDGVEHGGDKVSFHRKRLLGTLARADHALLRMARCVKLQAGDDLAGEHLQALQVTATEGVGLERANGNGAQNHA